MRIVGASMVFALAVGLGGGARADPAEVRLEDGAYEVDVRLALPNLDDNTATRRASICIGGGGGGGTDGLAVLSENNPLAHCPASNVRRDGDTLTFDIVCAGGNAARASAVYTLAPPRFEGRITMKMGGKNMTMTETQSGRRMGACEVGVPPS